MAGRFLRSVACIIARNEADRYLKDTILSVKPLVDKVLLLDDNSTDGTAALAWDLGCDVRQRSGEPMWGQESSARQELWQWGCEEAGEGWVYIADADHVTVADPDRWQMLLTSWNVNAWAFPLLDCWTDENTFRTDGFWRGYTNPRPWLFRPASIASGGWNERGIHCGHAPSGDWCVGVVPQGIFIKHLGWSKREDREEKYKRYMSRADDLTPFERAHVLSVLD